MEIPRLEQNPKALTKSQGLNCIVVNSTNGNPKALAKSQGFNKIPRL
jgi:hypothetical protein